MFQYKISEFILFCFKVLFKTFRVMEGIKVCAGGKQCNKIFGLLLSGFFMPHKKIYSKHAEKFHEMLFMNKLLNNVSGKFR